MRFHSIFGLALLYASVSALPAKRNSNSPGYVSLPLTKGLQIRRGASKSRQEEQQSGVLHNEVFNYYVDASIGTPPQPLKLYLDTGSSDIWVFSEAVTTTCPNCTDVYYDATASSTFVDLSGFPDFNISYVDGTGVNGYYVGDVIGVGNVEVDQTIGVATEAKGDGFNNGMLGIGLDAGQSIAEKGAQAQEGFIEALFQSGKIDVRAYSINLNAKNPGDTAAGEIIFGGINSDKFEGDLVAFPMVIPAPDGHFRLTIAEPSIIFDAGAGPVTLTPEADGNTVVMDTGTSFTHIPTEQFLSISAAVDAQPIEESVNYSVDCALADNTNDLAFEFNGPNGKATINVPWAQMVIHSEKAGEGRCLFGLMPRTTEQAQGVYILGDTFLRSAYLLFNYDDSTISLAQVKYDDQEHSEPQALRRRK